MGPDVQPTLAQPLPVPGATQVSMSNAASAFGAAIVLPNSPQVASSSAGTVWMNQARGETAAVSQTSVRITFPAQDLIIGYERPAPPNAVAYLQESANSDAGSKLIWLGSTPAWYIPAPSDGSNWGDIELIVGGTMIDVMGHTNQGSLQAVAQSIVDQAASSG